MWSPRSFLYLSLVSQLSLVIAHPWIVTDVFEEHVYTNDYLIRTSTFTDIVQISPTVTSLPEALSTITRVSTGGYYQGDDDVTVVQKLYPSGVGKPVAYDPWYDASSYIFKVNLTYTAPTGCSSQWTRTVAADVTPPQVAKNLLPNAAEATGSVSLSIDDSRAFQPITYTYTVLYVDPTQVPSSSLESLSYSHRPTELYTAAGCAYTSTSDSDSYPYYNRYDHYNTPWFLDDYYMGISPLALTLTVSIGWIGLFIILGFLEAWIRFKRLMTGWQTRRGLPVCWALTILPITLLLLCWFKKGYRARSSADAEILNRRWEAMGAWTKLRLFFAWGFRFKYPPMLGPAPAMVKTSKQPSKNPGPRLLGLTPPGTPILEADASRATSVTVTVNGPEMFEAGDHHAAGGVQPEHVGRAQ